MTKERGSIPEIKQRLLDGLQPHNPKVHVRFKRNTLGWFKMRIVSTHFKGMTWEEREAQIDTLLGPQGLRLAGYPFLDYDFLTPEEVQRRAPEKPIPVPLWSEILMAAEPDPDEFFSPDGEVSKRPFVVTFYSFCGGHSAALQVVAGILARSHRVVMLDFALQTPALSTLFPPSPPACEGRLGVVDYLHQRQITPDFQFPPLEDCIRHLDTQRDIYLIPAGEDDEGYLHRLTDLNMRGFYQRSEPNAIHLLMDDIKSHLSPDVILIDAQSGFDSASAVALFDLADLAMICFSPTSPNFNGLKWVTRAARKQIDYYGKPELHFLLTLTNSGEQASIAKAEDWLKKEWGAYRDVAIHEMYHIVPVNPQLTTHKSLLNGLPEPLKEPYRPISKVIESHLPPLSASATQSTLKAEELKAALGDEE